MNRAVAQDAVIPLLIVGNVVNQLFVSTELHVWNEVRALTKAVTEGRGLA